MGDRAIVVPLKAVERAVATIVALHARRPLDAVLAVDDQGLMVAAPAAERLGMAHNPPAAAAARDKAALRALLAASSVPQPVYRVVAPGHRLRRRRPRSATPAWSSRRPVPAARGSSGSTTPPGRQR